MATWKRLTGVDGNKLDVNMDQVCLMQQFKDYTTLHFRASQSDRRTACMIAIAADAAKNMAK
jgi:hypothetical protein